MNGIAVRSLAPPEGGPTSGSFDLDRAATGSQPDIVGNFLLDPNSLLPRELDIYFWIYLSMAV